MWMYLYLKQQFSNVWSQDLCILLKVIEIPQRVFFLLVTSINIYHLENYTEKKICYCFNVFFKMYIICNLSFYPFLSIQFNGINYVHIVVQPSPLSICRPVLFLQNWNSVPVKQYKSPLPLLHPPLLGPGNHHSTLSLQIKLL